MILIDAYKKIGRKTGLAFDSTTDTEIMNDAMAEALKEISRRVKPGGTKEISSFTTTSGISEYYLNPRVLYPTSFIDTTDTPEGNELIIKTEEDFKREVPTPNLTDTGDPTIIIPLGKFRLKAQPTANSVVTIVSDSTSDNTAALKFVSIMGLVSGIQVTERVQLNGTTPVASINTFDVGKLVSVTKDSTTGTITVTTNSGAVEVEKLIPNLKENIRWKVQLLEKIPGTIVRTIEYSYYRRPWIFTNNEDPIPLDEMWEDVFFTKTVAIVFAEQGDKKADKFERDAERKLDDMADDDYFAENTDLRFGFDDVSYEAFE